MAHKTMKDGTVYDITGGSVLTGGTSYALQQGKTLESGTLYHINFGEPYLERVQFNERSATSFTGTDSLTSLSGRVAGGTGSGYAGIRWDLKKNGQWYLLQKGDVVQFSFTGSVYYRDYAAYGIIFSADLESTYPNGYYTRLNMSAESLTYTVTKACYCKLLVQIGGSTNTNLSASINVTEFKVNGKPIWVA